jgi:hypothetical protein
VSEKIAVIVKQYTANVLEDRQPPGVEEVVKLDAQARAATDRRCRV